MAPNPAAFQDLLATALASAQSYLESQGLISPNSTAVVPSAAAVAIALLTLLAYKRLTSTAGHAPHPWPTSTNADDVTSLPLPPFPKGAWPILGHLPILATNMAAPHKALQALAHELGPVYMLQLGASKAVVVSDEASAREALIKRGKDFSGRFPTRLWWILSENGSNMAYAQYGEGWRKIRRAAHKILTPLALSSMDARLEEEAVRLVKHLQSEGEGGARAIEMSKLFRRYAANVISSKALGVSYQDLDDSVLTDVLNAIADMFRLTGVGGIEDYLGQGAWTKNFLVKGLIELISAPKVRGMKSVTERIHKGIVLPRLNELLSKLKDETPEQRAGRNLCYAEELLITHILEPEGDPEEALPFNRIKHLLADLVMAGTDSTAGTLTWLAVLLVNNPESQRKAHAELDKLRDANGNRRLPMLADIDSLPYVRAIIKETLRAIPVGPLGLPHMCTEDSQIGGYFIPAGTQLILNVVDIHESIYPGAGVEFKPERWLTGMQAAASSKSAVKSTVKGQTGDSETGGLDILDGVYTFGQGRRMCPGVHLAYRELFLVTSQMLSAFELQCGVPGKKQISMEEVFGLAVLPKEGAHIKFVPRPGLAPIGAGRK